MKLVSLEYKDLPRSEWEEFTINSTDAWFWHTREWADYSAVMLGDQFVADVSFGIVTEKKLTAIAPAMVILDSEGRRSLGLGQQPMPWPAFPSWIEGRVRRKVEREVFQRYEAIARTYKCNSIGLFGAVTAESFYLAGRPVGNYPLRYGYTGTDYLTQVIDLTLSAEQLWRDVRKGHKAVIRRGERELEISSFKGPGGDEAFAAYQKLHALAAGRVTRSQSTFDTMCEWLQKGSAILVGAKIDKQWIGFVYVILFKKSGFYASACNLPEYEKTVAIGHALLWRAILTAKDAGIELLEMGMQTYASPVSKEEDVKVVNISSFKRGFGGFQMPRFHANLLLSDESQ